MTEESATDDFNLDSALEGAMEQIGKQHDSQEVQDQEIAEVEEIEAEEKPSASGEQAEVKAEKPIDPPVSWTAEAKEKFAKLPPDVQEYITQRESEREKLLTQKSTEYSEQQRKYEALEQILSPRRQALSAMYGGEAQALGQLFQLSDFANNDPMGFVQWFAQQRGLNLQQLNAVAETNDEYVDPATKQLRQELNTIKLELNNQKQTEVAARQEAVRSEISAFKEEKDESGNALHPHFDEVRKEMASLMQSGAAKNLDHAYKMAIWANEGVRSKILDEQKKAEETKRLEAAKQAASKAEKAKGVTVKSKKGGEASTAKKGDWESTLSEAVEELYGAA